MKFTALDAAPKVGAASPGRSNRMVKRRLTMTLGSV
jgi:hypothetical protein